MKVSAALTGVRLLFLDTAPIIYYVENVSPYRRTMDEIVKKVAAGAPTFVTSTITLAECLIHPLRRADEALATRFRLAITQGMNTRYVGVDHAVEQAAELRAKLGFSLTDALQIAAAISAGCDAFLTNDAALAKAPGIRVLVLGDIEPD